MYGNVPMLSGNRYLPSYVIVSCTKMKQILADFIVYGYVLYGSVLHPNFDLCR